MAVHIAEIAGPMSHASKQIARSDCQVCASSLHRQLRRIEVDIERTFRPLKLGGKNHLFAGSGRAADGWTTVCSLITTASAMTSSDSPNLQDVLERMSNGHPG